MRCSYSIFIILITFFSRARADIIFYYCCSSVFVSKVTINFRVVIKVPKAINENSNIMSDFYVILLMIRFASNVLIWLAYFIFNVTWHTTECNLRRFCVCLKSIALCNCRSCYYSSTAIVRNIRELEAKHILQCTEQLRHVIRCYYKRKIFWSILFLNKSQERRIPRV